MSIAEIIKCIFSAKERHPEKICISKPAFATNVILAFIWSWNNFLWPLIITRSAELQTLPLGLARFLSYQEDTTGALYAFCIMVLAPGIALFLLAQRKFISGLALGARRGDGRRRFAALAPAPLSTGLCWCRPSTGSWC